MDKNYRWFILLAVYLSISSCTTAQAGSIPISNTPSEAAYFNKILIDGKNGDPSAQLRLANIYRYGTYYKQDIKEAARWYRLATGNDPEYAINPNVAIEVVQLPNDISINAASDVLDANLYSAEATPEVPPYNFANLPWGATKNQIMETLSLNYRFVSEDDDGDLSFVGSLAGQSIQIVAYMADAALVRVLLYLSPDKNEYLSDYRRFKSLLSDRYGRPSRDDEVYRSPYERLDGYEEQAIRLSKGTLRTEWPDGNDGSNLSMLSLKSLNIMIAYDTSAGMSEERRRGDVSALDL